MTFYLFTCSMCATEFEVARSVDELGRPVTCPTDGAVARRAYGPPSSTQRTAPSQYTTRPTQRAWGGYLHDHGPGTEMHWHGPAG